MVASTDPTAKHGGISLLMVERGMDGFSRGRKLDKIGMRAQDTAELVFDDVRVPAENLLGDEGQGFVYLMQALPQERLSIAVGSVAGAQAALDVTLDYVKQREAFGRPVGSFQHSRFLLAELKTKITIGQTFVDRCIEALNAGELTVDEAAMAKWWLSDLLGEAADAGVQLHGGYGYMREYPIARAWTDARVQRIYGGDQRDHEGDRRPHHGSVAIVSIDPRAHPQLDRFLAAMQGEGFAPGEELPFHHPGCYGCGPDNPTGLQLVATPPNPTRSPRGTPSSSASKARRASCTAVPPPRCSTTSSVACWCGCPSPR